MISGNTLTNSSNHFLKSHVVLFLCLHDNTLYIVVYSILTEQLCFLSEMYQEIEATLTEMESCMRLLFPDYGLTDTQSVGSSPSTSHSANGCLSDDQQPCCSKDVKADRKEGKKQQMCRSSKEETGNGKKKNPEEDGEKTEQKRSSEEEGKEEKWSDDEERECERRRDGIEQVEKEGTVEDREKTEKGNSDVEEEEDEEEEAFDGDVFIRNAGLISHSYSLDLNLSPGGYSPCASTH